jgi:hypothetical protein
MICASAWLRHSPLPFAQSVALPWKQERSRAQMLSLALAEIIGARRLWTVSMISAVSMPSR